MGSMEIFFLYNEKPKLFFLYNEKPKLCRMTNRRQTGVTLQYLAPL